METIFGLLEGSFGALIMSLSGLLFIVTLGIVFPIVAFGVAWWWGVLCFLFAGPATLIFTILHFQRAKIPFLVTIISGIVAIGMFMIRSFMTTFFTVAQ
ncbi:MAG: hypothetical protein RL326_257 [Pseudomonadota bacterium]|jgi:hypothetical protein